MPVLNIRQRKFRQVARISSASARHRVLPYHCISQSFDLHPATTSVSHLTCPLPPHHQSVLALTLELELALVLEIQLALALDIERYHVTASVNHLTCPLPPHQSVRASVRDRASASIRHRALLYQSVIWLAPCHHISQSFDLPTATTYHQSELSLVLALEIELVLVLDIERYHITASVNHLTCPLPWHQSVIWLAHCHHIISQC